MTTSLTLGRMIMRFIIQSGTLLSAKKNALSNYTRKRQNLQLSLANQDKCSP